MVCLHFSISSQTLTNFLAFTCSYPFTIRVHSVRTWRTFSEAWDWAHARSTWCCLFTNQAWNIPLCWPAQFLYLHHWSLRQDADWLLSAGEQWWKYLQSGEEKKKKTATNTELTHRLVFKNVFCYKRGMFKILICATSVDLRRFVRPPWDLLLCIITAG